MPDGSYAGNPCGFILTRENRSVYFACDTVLFSDMKVIGAAGLDLAALPIGDNYTMGSGRCPGGGSFSLAGSCRSTTAPGRSLPKMPMPGPVRSGRKRASRRIALEPGGNNIDL